MALFIVENFNPNEDFWEQNPQLQYIPPFSDFKKKRNSSKIMTAIYMIWDPASKINKSGMAEADVIKDINSTYLGKEDFDWSGYTHVIDAFKDKCISPSQRLLKDWERQLEELDKMLDNWGWDPKTAKDKMTILKEKKTVWDDYLEIKAKVEEERSVAQNYANYQESALESGELLGYIG